MIKVDQKKRITVLENRRISVFDKGLGLHICPVFLVRGVERMKQWGQET